MEGKYDAAVVDCYHSLPLCSEKMKMSPLNFFFFWGGGTPTSPWVPFRLNFGPNGDYFALVPPSLFPVLIADSLKLLKIVKIV